jgi:hypothetical protein
MAERLMRSQNQRLARTSAGQFATAHGARALTTRLFSTRPPTRIADRQRRALRAIQRALTAQPLEHLHALTIGRLTRFEVILQSYEAWCLAHPEEPAPKHMLAVANAWRRTGEFLALLNERLERSAPVESLHEYLERRGRELQAEASAQQNSPQSAAAASAPEDEDAEGDAEPIT